MADINLKKYRVPRTAITEKGLRKLLRKSAAEHPSMAEWAIANKITPQAVSAFMREVQTAGLQIPEALGYRPQIIYLPVDEEPISHMNPPRRVAKRPSKKVDHSKDPVEKRGFLKDDRKATKERLKKRA